MAQGTLAPPWNELCNIVDLNFFLFLFAVYFSIYIYRTVSIIANIFTFGFKWCFLCLFNRFMFLHIIGMETANQNNFCFLLGDNISNSFITNLKSIIIPAYMQMRGLKVGDNTFVEYNAKLLYKPQCQRNIISRWVNNYCSMFGYELNMACFYHTRKMR